MSRFRTDGRTESGTDGHFFLILTHIHMTHVNFLFHKLLVSETHTDRQDKFVIDTNLANLVVTESNNSSGVLIFKINNF